MTTVKATCRICINCGFELDVADNQIVSFRTDYNHPLSQGYACPKGIAGIELQQGRGERITRSYKRDAAGKHRVIDPHLATREIGKKLAAIIREHGPRAVAMFYGTGAYANTLGNIMSKSWLHATGSKNLFTTMTIDQSNHWITASRMGMFLGGEPDVDTIDVALVAGSNPMVSHLGSGFIPVHAVNPGKNLNEAKRRGQKLIVIDPRVTETARLADLHLQIIPGEDATLFAGLLHQLFEKDLVNRAFCERFATNVERLRKAVSAYTLDYVADRCGVSAEHIVEAARLFGTAKKPHAGCCTGTSMAPDSNLADFLMESMNVLCAGYRLGGESVPNQGIWGGVPKVADVYPPNRTWETGYQCRTQKTGQIFGELPSALLPDEILQPGDDRIRALVVFGGNPASALVDPDKSVAAFKDLELLVTLDHRMSETAQLSHYVISTSTQYERHDLNAMTEGLAKTTYLHYFRPPLRKPDTALDDWEAFYEIAQAMGLQLDFKHFFLGVDYGALPHGRDLDMNNKPSNEQLIRWLCEERNVSFEELTAAEYGISPDLPPASVIVPEHDSGARLDVCPDDIAEDIERVRNQSVGRDKYRLSVRRLPVAMNSHYRNSDYAKRKFPQNFAYMNPSDMAREGLVDGNKIDIRSDFGAIIGIVRQDPTLRAGVISMSHCYGKLDRADDPEAELGSHTGRLIPLDATRAETINFMPHKTGIAVTVRAI